MVVSANGDRARGEGAEAGRGGGCARRSGAATLVCMTDTARADGPVVSRSAADVVERVVQNLGAGRAGVARDARAVRPLRSRRGAPDHRGLPRRREDGAREVRGALARPLVLPAAVHSGPAADRRDRRQRLQPAHERVRVQARPGVRERPPRRRDQPRVPEDAVGAPRGDAGDPGHDRRRDVRARAAVLRGGHAEPDRVRGDVSAPRGAARPLHGAPVARLPAVRRGGADARRADDVAAARPPGGRR